MTYDELFPILSSIQGCTFATLDAETFPVKGVKSIKKTTVGERVILFTNKTGSGYENMVRRRLVEAGKNPDDFYLMDLPWGERVTDTPLIIHKGDYYLQCILLSPGVEKYTIFQQPATAEGLGIKEKRRNQGLPAADEVVVKTYKLESITKLTVMGETFEDKGQGRTTLSVKF